MWFAKRKINNQVFRETEIQRYNRHCCTKERGEVIEAFVKAHKMSANKSIDNAINKLIRNLEDARE